MLLNVKARFASKFYGKKEFEDQKNGNNSKKWKKLKETKEEYDY